MIINQSVIDDNGTNHYNSPIQYGQELLEQFVPIDILIRKTKRGNYLQLRIFNNFIGETDFELVPKMIC
ncbi:MAG: hypothetical protein ACFE8U_04635 [Candidatus Hermodarchaeota archaeon]